MTQNYTNGPKRSEKTCLKGICQLLPILLLTIFTFSPHPSALAQNVKRTITGSVIDGSGEPLIGVTVIIKGTQAGTSTDSHGWFSVDVPEGSNQLVFSYLGFKEKVADIGTQNSLLVQMESDAMQMDDVVIVGYGTQKKESIIGAISTINPDILQRNQTSNISNSLAGQLPGIIGFQRSGEPGYDASDFWIRGISTFGAGSSPLIIIDGVERDLDRLIPEEIESFSVLKDAAATAVYGVRGANGAIVIRTKRGELGKPKVSIKADYGITAPLKIAQYVDGATHMDLVNEAARMSGVTEPYDPMTIELTRMGADPDLYPSVNWLKKVTSDIASNWRVNADVGGGTNLIKYRLVSGVYHENGLIGVKNSQYNNRVRLTKYNVRSNVDINITPSTLFELSVGAYIQDRHAPDTGIATILKNAMETPPMVHPTIYSNGQIPKQSNRTNPWAQATQTGYSRRYDSSVQSVASLKQDIGALWEPLKGLEVKALFSFDMYDRFTVTRSRKPFYYLATGRDAEGVLETTAIDIDGSSEFLGFSKSSTGNRSMYFEVPLTYSRAFGKNSVDGMLLWNMRSYVDKGASSAINSFPYRNSGLAGRVAYNYDMRYFAEFNFGYNGSENFADGYRYGFFPSVAAGWIVTGEKFMQPVKHVISLLRIRGSWGQAGNDQIGGSRRFGYLTTIKSDSNGGYDFGYNKVSSYTGVSESEFGVYNLTWETSTKTNIGIDLELFNSLYISADYFTENRDNIFMQRKTIPELAGFQSNPYANYGKVRNQGIEASVNYNKQFNRNTYLSVLANFTYARNEIKEYDEAAGVVGTSRAKTGHSVSQNFGLIADGLYTDDDFINVETGQLKNHMPVPMFTTVKPGDIRYIDANGDGKITLDDVTAIGNPNVPEIVYGFGFSLRYKRFDVSALFQGQAKVDFIINENNIIPGAGMGALGNILTNAYDHWTPENPSQDVFYPRLSFGTNENNKQESTWWLFNGSFLRLKNFEIGYSVVRQKSFIDNLRIYARGTNLLTFSGFKLWDPEQQGAGFKTYPLTRIFSIGVDITFK